MEKNGRIILIDKELTEKQQALSRFIECYTHIPFTGETYNEWSMWVALNKDFAEHEKAKQAEEPKTEPRKQKSRDRKRGREVAVDANRLYAAIKSIGENNSHVCAVCGFGHAYLSHVKSRGWLYESDIEKLSDAGIDAGDYVTDEWYRAKYLIDEEPVVEEDAPKVTQLLIDSKGMVTLNQEDAVTLPVTDRMKAFCLLTNMDTRSMAEKAIEEYIDGFVVMGGFDPAGGTA